LAKPSFIPRRKIMAQVNPFTGMTKILASTPRRWKPAVVHASNYVEGDAALHSVGIGLYTSDGGEVTYHDMYDAETTITLLPGILFPTSVIRITAFTGSDLQVGFITGPLA
jgi:hypothetical protein